MPRLPALLLFLASHALVPAADLASLPADLATPPATDGPPAPGKRVRAFQKDSAIHHLLYLPTDWEQGKSYPVIVEYPGNRWQTSPGTVEGCNLGYGITAGKGALWVCMPFVDPHTNANAPSWWGDAGATIAYCKRTVKEVCENHGGDPSRVILAGFSRGSIACNYIGLHDDAIAALWCGFICHSHYDGVRSWPYPGSDRPSAALRLARLGKRPQFISHEQTTSETEAYLRTAHPSGNFTFQACSFSEHTDIWVLRDTPERKALRNWFQRVTAAPPATP